MCNAQEATAILAAVNYFYNLSRATVHEVGVCPLEAVAYANQDLQGLPLVSVYINQLSHVQLMGFGLTHSAPYGVT